MNKQVQLEDHLSSKIIETTLGLKMIFGTFVIILLLYSSNAKEIFNGSFMFAMSFFTIILLLVEGVTIEVQKLLFKTSYREKLYEHNPKDITLRILLMVNWYAVLFAFYIVCTPEGKMTRHMWIDSLITLCIMLFFLGLIMTIASDLIAKKIYTTTTNREEKFPNFEQPSDST